MDEPAVMEAPAEDQPVAVIIQPQTQPEELQIVVQEVPENVQEADQIYQAQVEGEQMQCVETIEGSSIAIEEEGDHMATVQLGSLNCKSVQELAEHLPNIGIHFTCKKCQIVCTQMNELLTHLASGDCQPVEEAPPSAENGHLEPSSADASTPATPKRKRGRPRKSETPRDQPREPLPVNKDVDYEELPRLAAEPEVVSRSGRQTRYSMGKIKRLDVLTLLGGRIKEEPVDEDEDDEFKLDTTKKGLKEQEEVELEDDEISGDDDEDWSPRKRPRLRPAEDELLENISGDEMMEVTGIDGQMKLKPVPQHPTVSFRKEGSANLIVLDSGGKPDTDPDIVSFVKDALGEEEGEGGENTGKEKPSESEAGESTPDKANDKENLEGEETGNDELQNKTSKVIRATQGVNYMGLGRHRLVKKRYHKCTICKQRFFHTKEELTIHHECHRNKKQEEEMYTCALETCNYETKAWNRMLDHLCRHDEYKQKFKDHTFVKNILGDFTCPICKKKFDRKNNMKGHLAKVHFKQKRSCDICGKVFDGVDEKTFKRHVEKCQNLLFQCSHCDYKTPVSANMRKHMKIHLGQGYTCDVCQAVFPSKQRCFVHRQTHETNRKQYHCEQCSTVFLSLDALKKHIIRFHTETSTIYACSDCNFKTKIHTDLKKHFAHVHDKKFKCEHCPYQTNSSQAFEQHQEYHTPGRSFACNYENCYYRGATPKQLANHIGQVHKNTKKYQCPICHKFYKKKTHLARHLVTHTEDKPYACLECGLEFNNHSTYYRHRNKTGHDAKREGIVSVPQNITIHYVNPDGEGIGQEGIDDQRVIQHFDGEQTYQVITQGEGGEYITTTTAGAEQPEDDGKKQNIIMLETEDGEPVTYVLRMSENENGETTIVTEDGVSMDANIVQQIQEQLQLLQQGMGEEGETEVTEVVAQDVHEQVTLDGNMEVISGGLVMDSGVVYAPEEAGTAVLQDVESQVQVVTADGLTVDEKVVEGLVVAESADVTQQVYTEISPEFQQTEEQVENLPVEQDLPLEGETSVDMVNEWVVEQVEEVGDGKHAQVQHYVEQEQIGEEDVQQVIYEESVVEVGNPRGEDGDGKKQYAIVLLPSTAASGDEPEAALSMLQLQSGNTITMGEDGVEYIVQHTEEQ